MEPVEVGQSCYSWDQLFIAANELLDRLALRAEAPRPKLHLAACHELSRIMEVITT